MTSSNSRPDTTTNAIVEGHYARRGDLASRILEALKEAGYDPADLTYKELGLVDQMHIRGHQATRDLLALLAPAPGSRLLDVGCGIGGPARMIAAEADVTVIGLDLTLSYCQASRRLNEAAGLDDSVHGVCASATAMPFADGAFALVWSQHAAMNIPDKTGLYREMARVVEPGGRVAIYDVMCGAAGAPHFPVPWSATPEGSFLLPAEEIRALILSSGLEQLLWRDMTQQAIAWNRERQEKAAAAKAAGKGGPALGPQVIMGPEFADMVSNLGRNLEEGRVSVFQGIFRKPGGPGDDA